ncbi:MAG: NAD(+) synthase [Clostridia bacterium]|nr:NAD(+) synthase [Clostridia bacterium]
MQHGFIKVAAATPQITVAGCRTNLGEIKKQIDLAQQQGAHLLVFPELCITGYTCGDLFLQSLLADEAQQALLELVSYSHGIQAVIVVGLPLRVGYRLYNCAAVIHDGSLLGIVPKTHIPNYGEFYEKRYFTPAPADNTTVTIGALTCPFGAKLLFSCKELPEFTVGIEICEDVWVANPVSNDLAPAGAYLIVNCSASDETIGKSDYRRALVQNQSARLLCGYIYADAGDGESTTDMVFAGHNIICENGTLLAESPLFQNQLICTEIDLFRLRHERQRMSTYTNAAPPIGYQTISFSMPKTETALTRMVSPRPFVPAGAADLSNRCEEILAMQSQGLKTRLQRSYSKTAVVGISGGLDSCLALLVTVRAMDQLSCPRKDIVAVTMPCFGTTARTKTNAELLCERLGVTLRTIDIAAAVEQHFSDIGHAADDYSVVFENAQARERTQILMDIANQTDGIVIGTGDLSELALGWATYNGDHMSMYGVNVSIPKTLVRHIVEYEAAQAKDTKLKEVLLDILATPISPELLPPSGDDIAQKTEEIVGSYDLHDFFLYYAIRFGFPPAKVLRLADYAFAGQFDHETVLSWLKLFYRRFFSQQFKRSCLPDGPKVGSVALSPRGDWRMPSDASASAWLEELEKLS